MRPGVFEGTTDGIVKVAYHFNAGHPAFGSWYGPAVEKVLWPSVLGIGAQRLSTKVYVGDLPLALVDSEARPQFWKKWLTQSQNGWRRLSKRIEDAAGMDIFVVCFDTLNRQFARDLHKRLMPNEGYLGAVEIDDTSEFHWHFYSDALRLEYRVTDSAIALFYDCLEAEEPTLEEKDEQFKRLNALGFAPVTFESRNGRHTFFDKYHDWKHARRVADWRNRFGDQLAMIADDVASRLGDAAPELADRLWTAMDTFERAETDEHYRNVCHSCRGIIEYVADTLFPPKDEIREGRKLGVSNYRNRLLAFVEDQGRVAQTIDRRRGVRVTCLRIF